MAEPQPKYVTTADGRQITYERWQYEQTVQQQATLKRVNDLLIKDATNAVSVGATFPQQEYGALLRMVVPTLLDQWGKVNATAAIQYYDELNVQWLTTYGDEARQQASRKNVRRQAERYALARTQSALAVSQGYAAKYADDYDVAAKTDAVMNFAMKVRAEQGHAPSVAAMNNALTREVAAYHRDTVLFNSALDSNVHSVQRVANPGACEFCRLMALGSTRGSVRRSTYAARFHANCHCTIKPLFKGEAPVHPDYYKEFEAEYEEVYKGNSSKDTLIEWRALRERKAAAATKASAALPVVGVRKMSPDAPEKWFWQGSSSLSQDEIHRLNTLSRTIPLTEVRQELPLLTAPDTLENAAIVTNPKYASKEPGYSTNCVRATNAYELRRRGYDVTASPKLRPNDLSQNPLFFEQGWKDAAGNDVSDTTLSVRRNRKRGTLTDNTAQTILDNYPDGSRGWVHFDWERSGAGHIVNWEVRNSEVVFVDAQIGDIDDKVRDYFPRAKNIRLNRLDDKTPQAYVLQYLEGFNQ